LDSLENNASAIVLGCVCENAVLPARSIVFCYIKNTSCPKRDYVFTSAVKLSYLTVNEITETRFLQPALEKRKRVHQIEVLMIIGSPALAG
jgi:hypothetical protein